MLDTFKKFLPDEHAEEMFITGRAGTGKTYGLAELIQFCLLNNIDFTVCAFTHKACGILREALPHEAGTFVRTLHSYLKKRPTINTEAHNHKHISISKKSGQSEITSILFIDEYSMVGERDLMDIREEQDNNEGLKIVWLGDPNQLPPVGDAQTIKPHGNYQLVLTKQYRQAKDNPLIIPLEQLVGFIEGKDPEPLIENEAFIRKQDVVEWYNNDSMDKSFDGVMLAYTNERVQYLNAEAQGRKEPEVGDRLFSPTTKHHYNFLGWLDFVPAIDKPFGEPLTMDSKYKTLEFLLTQGYRIAQVEDDSGELMVFMCIFGHHDYKLQTDALKKNAASSNKAIGPEAAIWAKNNQDTDKAKSRAKAWREFLSFNEAVICLDFAHAMTVHKSQGSTYKSIYLDTEDLGIAAEFHYQTYLKLMYVAISRASSYVITN